MSNDDINQTKRYPNRTAKNPTVPCRAELYATMNESPKNLMFLSKFNSPN